MTDLTQLGIAAIRDGVRAGSFSAREVAEASGARDVGVWLAVTTRRRRGDGVRDLRLATALAGGPPQRGQGG